MRQLKESTRYIIALLLVVSSLVVLVGYDGKEKNNTVYESYNSQLDSNQTELHYMYTNDDGSYLLDSKASVENVIYVSHEDMVNWIGESYMNELEHGDKIVGTFDDEALWELVGLDY